MMPTRMRVGAPAVVETEGRSTIWVIRSLMIPPRPATGAGTSRARMVPCTDAAWICETVCTMHDHAEPHGVESGQPDDDAHEAGPIIPDLAIPEKGHLL